MLASPPATVSVRSCVSAGGVHLHDFARLVLTPEGPPLIDIVGTVVTRSLAAFVNRGPRHEQASKPSAPFLIVDRDSRFLDPSVADRLTSQPLVPLAVEADSLTVDTGLPRAKGAVPLSTLRAWTSLTLVALTGADPPSASQLAGLS
jgi:hypothetical protein